MKLEVELPIQIEEAGEDVEYDIVIDNEDDNNNEIISKIKLESNEKN